MSINEKLDKILAKVELIADNQGKPPQDNHNQPDITFGELFQLYFEGHIEPYTRTPKNSAYLYRAHGVKWESTLVSKITRFALEQWVNELGKRSRSDARCAINMMSAAINWGIKCGYVAGNNPCRGVTRFKIKARERFLLPQEFARFKEALREEPEPLQHFFWLCLLTGARRGTVEAMRWDEVDLDLAIWQFDNKNGDTHCVPLVADAVRILQEIKRHASSEWVFPGTGRTGHMTQPKGAWNRILQRANIINLRVHDLRRTLASYMAIDGQSQYIIGQMLGHKDPSSTAIYARLNLDPVRKAAEAVAKTWQTLEALPARSNTQNRRESDAHKASDSGRQPKNASIRITNAEQIITEGKILTAIRSGQNIKKAIYKKVSTGLFPVNRFELERILNEMIERGLIRKYREAPYWHCWRYALCEDAQADRSNSQ